MQVHCARLLNVVFVLILVPLSQSLSTMKESEKPGSDKSSELIIERKLIEPDLSCCQIGMRAARKGYTCMVSLAIHKDRLNMPHRRKMKFHEVEKKDYDFALKMRRCAKNEKWTYYFYRCCRKNAKLYEKPHQTASVNKKSDSGHTTTLLPKTHSTVFPTNVPKKRTAAKNGTLT